MSSGTRIPFRTAYLAALVAGDLLYAACERLEIAGSLRRLDDQVGDIEFVAIPRMGTEQTNDLFNSTVPVNLLERRVAELGKGDQLVAHPDKPANGAHYKKLWLRDPGIQVDLFITTPEKFGPAFLIRTGPAEYSKAMVTRLRAKGLHSEDLVIKKIDGGAVVPCPDEATFFRLVGLPIMPPELRHA
jgi:DNA polymerase/3'-5' exonuclease PolX